MAGELARSVTRYPDDFCTQSFVVPIIGTGSALTGRVIPLICFDRDIVIDSAWLTVPGTSADNEALGTNVTATLFQGNNTDPVGPGITGTATAITDALAIGGTGNTAAARKVFALAATSGVPTNNIVTAGNGVGVSVTTSASVAAANVTAEYYNITIRFRTKNSFGAVGADELKKTA